jgi:hypothetical protein
MEEQDKLDNLQKRIEDLEAIREVDFRDSVRRIQAVEASVSELKEQRDFAILQESIRSLRNELETISSSFQQQIALLHSELLAKIYIRA